MAMPDPPLLSRAMALSPALHLPPQDGVFSCLPAAAPATRPWMQGNAEDIDTLINI